MKKIILTLGTSVFISISAYSQLYTPSGIIAGSSGSTSRVGVSVATPLAAFQVGSLFYLQYLTTGNNYIRASGTGNTYFDGVGNVGVGHQNQFAGYKFHVQGLTNLSGDVGIKIGNTPPQAPLHLKGNASAFLMEGTDHSFISFYPLGFGAGRKAVFGYTTASTSTISLKNEISGADVDVSVLGTGSINLNGRVWAKEVVVQLTDPWPDFVFSTSYQLNTLAQVEAYISKNNHLPNVPSAAEVAENGINIAEMDAILLQKIEELTLYTIAQQKQLDEQKKLIEEQSKLIEQLIIK